MEYVLNIQRYIKEHDELFPEEFGVIRYLRNLSLGIYPFSEKDIVFNLLSSGVSTFSSQPVSYNLLLISCLIVLHQEFPKIVSNDINRPDLQRFIVKDIMGDSVWTRTHIIHAKRLILKRFELYETIGLHITKFSFVYNLAMEASSDYYRITRSGASSTFGDKRLARVKDLLLKCFERGFTLSSFDAPDLDGVSPENYYTSCFKHCQNIRCLKGVSSGCCAFCLTYEFLWSVHKEYVNARTLFDLLYK